MSYNPYFSTYFFSRNNIVFLQKLVETVFCLVLSAKRTGKKVTVGGGAWSWSGGEMKMDPPVIVYLDNVKRSSATYPKSPTNLPPPTPFGSRAPRTRLRCSVGGCGRVGFGHNRSAVCPSAPVFTV